MGFLYIGPKDDYGYNQAHSEDAVGRQEDPGREGPSSKRRCLKTNDCQKTMIRP